MVTRSLDVMSIFAIADLHLSMAPDIDKPMDIYGPRWYNHAGRLMENWREMVSDDDTVIVAGDISWGLKLQEAKYDLDWIESLPGRKVMYKGNHDLWWTGITKLNKMYDNITFVQNDCFAAEDFVVCGTMGWLTPDNDDFTESDEKIYRRELLRMEASLKAGVKYIHELRGKGTGKEEDIKSDENTISVQDFENYPEMIVVMHFPPVSKAASFSGFQQLFEDYGIKRVFYGHIHGEDGFRNTIMGEHHGVDYQLISLDYLNCRPLLLERRV